jgi:inorganic pyrophosphatase/exopolyphosphatase
MTDTICFSNSTQRFSDRDVSAVERLESILGSEIAMRSEVYQQLIKAKNSINNLSVEQLLRKDMKVIECSANLKIAVSSISGTLVSNIISDDKQKLIEQFLINNKYETIVILGIDNNSIDSIRRDLAVFTKNNTLMMNVSHDLCQ